LEYQYKIDHYDDTPINNYIQEQEAEINRGIRLFPDINKTVKDYFNYVWSDINKNISETLTIEKCIWLSKFIDKIEKSQILHYSGYGLKKMVKHGGSLADVANVKSMSDKSDGGSKKSKKSKKSNKSNKSNKSKKVINPRKVKNINILYNAK
jgi:hypothetical protein